MKISKARFVPNYVEGIEVHLTDDQGPTFLMVPESVSDRDAPNRKVAEIDALIRYLTKWREQAMREYHGFVVVEELINPPVAAPFIGLGRWIQMRPADGQ